MTLPDSVVAAPDGSFSFEGVLTFGSAGQIGGWRGIDIANTQAGFIADCQCVSPACDRNEGDDVPVSVEGRLVDPALEGTLSVEFVVCSEPVLGAQVTILPAPSRRVPTIPGWGAGVLLLSLTIAAVRVRRGSTKLP